MKRQVLSSLKAEGNISTAAALFQLFCGIWIHLKTFFVMDAVKDLIHM